MKFNWLSLMMLIPLIVCVSIIPDIWGNTQYNGNLQFDSEQGYSQFKCDLIASGADWTQVHVLSSEPPILVQFNHLNVPKDYQFNYGKVSYSHRLAGIICGIFCVFFLIILGFFSKPEQSKT